MKTFETKLLVTCPLYVHAQVMCCSSKVKKNKAFQKQSALPDSFQPWCIVQSNLIMINELIMIYMINV